jgi:hypothetical protein
MQNFSLPIVAQLCLIFGMAGLFWPEKLVQIFDVLMFPWPATHRTVRIHSAVAILLAVALFTDLVIQIS